MQRRSVEFTRRERGRLHSQFPYRQHPGKRRNGLQRKTKQRDNASLLPCLSGKLLVIKDFGSILSLRDDTCREIYGQLREVYDGAYCKEWGNGQKLYWKGKVGIVAAVTPRIDQQHSLHSSLGKDSCITAFSPMSAMREQRRLSPMPSRRPRRGKPSAMLC